MGCFQSKPELEPKPEPKPAAAVGVVVRRTPFDGCESTRAKMMAELWQDTCLLPHKDMVNQRTFLVGQTCLWSEFSQAKKSFEEALVADKQAVFDRVVERLEKRNAELVEKGEVDKNTADAALEAAKVAGGKFLQ